MLNERQWPPAVVDLSCRACHSNSYKKMKSSHRSSFCCWRRQASWIAAIATLDTKLVTLTGINYVCNDPKSTLQVNDTSIEYYRSSWNHSNSQYINDYKDNGCTVNWLTIEEIIMGIKDTDWDLRFMPCLSYRSSVNKRCTLCLHIIIPNKYNDRNKSIHMCANIHTEVQHLSLLLSFKTKNCIWLSTTQSNVKKNCTL